MARTIVKTKRSRVHPVATLAPAAEAFASGDLDTWPRSWMGSANDLPPGQALLACVRPFIAHLASSSLTPKTIRIHVDNLWSLGGEIIRDLNDDPALRKVSADRLLRKVIHPDGGPLLHNASQEAQRSFDSTCRKLHRFFSNRDVPASTLLLNAPSTVRQYWLNESFRSIRADDMKPAP